MRKRSEGERDDGEAVGEAGGSEGGSEAEAKQRRIEAREK